MHQSKDITNDPFEFGSIVMQAQITMFQKAMKTERNSSSGFAFTEIS